MSKSKRDSLGDRMKKYEAVPKMSLMRRTPVILRLDGKAFHTFTKGFDRPFDEAIQRCMLATAKYLCENVQGCVLAYTQSDEITLVLCDYKNLESEAWFDYKVQKMVSVAASMATFKFLDELGDIVYEYYTADEKAFKERIDFLVKKIRKGAFFDARCFNLPREEVCNCLIWRQQDAIRNSIQALAQSLFPAKQLEGLSCDKLKEKMEKEKSVKWEDLDWYQRSGACVVRDYLDRKWEVDYRTPLFTEDRAYVNKRIYFEEDNYA